MKESEKKKRDRQGKLLTSYFLWTREKKLSS